MIYLKKRFLCVFILLLLGMIFSSVSASAEEGIIVTPTAGNCIEYSGWTGKSSLTRYDNVTMAPFGGGTALFTVPEQLDGWTDIYYYIPKFDTGYSTTTNNCSATLVVTDMYGVTESFFFNVLEGNGGEWIKVARARFSDDVAETINVTDGEGSSRLTNVRFVPSDSATYILTCDDFDLSADWDIRTQDTAYDRKCLQSIGSTGLPAAAKSNKLEPGEYYVYMHTGDFRYATGTRCMSLTLNGKDYKKTEDLYFGTHFVGTIYENSVTIRTGLEATFAWEKMTYPNETVTVGEDGVLEMQLHALNAYARADAIIITQDKDFVPFATVGGAVFGYERFPATIPYENVLPFPEEAKGELTNVTDTAVLENAYTKISFRKGVSDAQKTVVQREVTVGDTVVSPFENGYGFLSLYANESVGYQSDGYYGRFDVAFPEEDGEIIQRGTTNVFRAGIPEWLVPDTVEQVDASTVCMTADGTYMSLVATWTLEEQDLEPKVTVEFTAKKDGEYSLGFFNEVNETDKENVGYVLNPYRWQESRYPEPGETITETNSTTNHTQMTYKMNALGQEISLGVAVDRDYIALTVPVEGEQYGASRWPHDGVTFTETSTWDEDKYFDWRSLSYKYRDVTLDYTYQNADFVMNTTGANGGILPAIFAPKMASIDSAFKVGETYTFAFRPIATVSYAGENRGWYDAYKHVAQDLRGVYDYRDNYYSSMTDAAFNVLNFLMDDELSGWNDEMIGHYNIEDSYWVSNGNGLVYLQNYLLTEDAEILNERALPTMGALLTRDDRHFYRRYTLCGKVEGPINKELTSTNAPLGNATYEGAYLLSQGMTPIFRTVSKNRLNSTTVESAGLELKNTTDCYWYEYANGSTDFSLTRQNADDYLEKRAFLSADNEVEIKAFINISYTPQFQAQFDAYEFTGDEKYLAGAIEGARRFLPSLRITDMPQSKSDMRVEDTKNLMISDKVIRNFTWSYDGRGYRRGLEMKATGDGVDDASGSVYDEYRVVGYLDDAINFEDTAGEYPAWVTARTGLGVEQMSTCTEGKNIFMSTWAGDLLRLGYLSDDQLMMDLARSSIVGRFANYPGYYYTEYTRLPGLANYPTEGVDVTSLYFHHAPVFLAAIQDYLFSNAYVKSDGNVDFPNTRAQGYAWFNNRIYGHEAGKIYRENDMWPWLKEGTISLSSKQIDWIAGRKEGRAAFVLTNAGDEAVTDTVLFNAELGIADGAVVTVYDKDGNITEATVTDNMLSVTIPAKGILTVAVNGANIHAPRYSTVAFDDRAVEDTETSALGLMYQGNTYIDGKGYDVKAYALALDPENYMGYVFVGGRSTEEYAFVNKNGEEATRGGDGENGIVKSTLIWHFEGEDTVYTVVDDVFPYEFWIPVEDRNKKIVFTVETEYKEETKKLGQEYTLEPAEISTIAVSDKANFAPVPVKEYVTDVAMSDGKVMLGVDNRTSSVFGGMNVLSDNALEGCFLNGYLEVQDIDSSDAIAESGYLLFENVQIVQSKNNPSSGNVSLVLADPYTGITDADLDNWAVYDKDGNYLGIKQNVLHVSSGTEPYVWDNLYITNSNTDNQIEFTKEGNTYTISCDGAKYVKVLTVTYRNGVMSNIAAENVLVSHNNPKTITVTDINQKIFVWENEMYDGSTLGPLLPVLVK